VLIFNADLAYHWLEERLPWIFLPRDCYLNTDSVTGILSLFPSANYIVTP